MREISIPSPVDSDVETVIPLALIDRAPWNDDIKTPVSGVYRKGLEGNLDGWGNRDRLRVWPRDDAPGRYYAIDGNQRHRIFSDRLLFARVLEHLGTEATEKDVKAFMDSPDNIALLERFRLEAADIDVPVRIMTEVTDGVPMSRDDAKAFSLTWDRNKAKYDEAGVADTFRDLMREGRTQAAERLREHLRSIARPELPVVPPLSVYTPPALPEPAEGELEPEEEDTPWGPAPPPLERPAKPGMTLIPIVFSVTSEAAAKIEASIVKLRISRLFKERALIDALAHLERLVEADDLDAAINDAIVEAALLNINTHIKENTS